MTRREDKLDHYEIAPGCFIVSSAGIPRTPSMADTVRAICEEADARYERQRFREAMRGSTYCPDTRKRR